MLRGEDVPRMDESGNEVAFAWSIAVESVSRDSWIGHSPTVAMTTNDGFDALIGALRDHPATENALLAWAWQEGWDGDLKGHVAAGYSVTNSGSGLKSIPLGVVLTPRAAQNLGTLSQQTVDANGSSVQVTVLDLGGSGLQSIPLGITVPRFTFAFLDGSGLKSIPLGFKPTDAAGDGKLVPLDKPATMAGANLAAQLGAGGWRVDGYDAASFLGSSTELGIEPGPAHQYNGSGYGAVPVDLP
ncbi:MAG: hypothetical protein AAGA48_38780 [Myxococcota bacterium]